MVDNTVSDVTGGLGAKNAFSFVPLLYIELNRSFYQDRLETNIGKVEKKATGDLCRRAD